MHKLMVILYLKKEHGKHFNSASEFNPQVLTRDHKPELPDEMDRIIKNNGRVERYTSNY